MSRLNARPHATSHPTVYGILLPRVIWPRLIVMIGFVLTPPSAMTPKPVRDSSRIIPNLLFDQYEVPTWPDLCVRLRAPPLLTLGGLRRSPFLRTTMTRSPENIDRSSLATDLQLLYNIHTTCRQSSRTAGSTWHIVSNKVLSLVYQKYMFRESRPDNHSTLNYFGNTPYGIVRVSYLVQSTRSTGVHAHGAFLLSTAHTSVHNILFRHLEIFLGRPSP